MLSGTKAFPAVDSTAKAAAAHKAARHRRDSK